jgi:RNA polymerase sigma-70 factor, ECF subfamily
VNSALSDEELVAKYLAAGGPPHGTPFAEELFSRHYSRVALWCLRIAGDRDSSAGLAQEVFSLAWQQLDHFPAESKFTTWLYTIARDHCFSAGKKMAPATDEGDEAAGPDLLDPAQLEFDSALERAQLMEAARGFMASELTPVEAQVVTLHYSDELPLEAIARLLKMENISASQATAASARRKLKSAVERWLAGRSAGRKEGAGPEGN